MNRDPFNAVREGRCGDGSPFNYFALAALQSAGMQRIARLPVSIRLVLESALRHCDGNKITPTHVRQIANWQPQAERSAEIPFVVARILLQDFTGVPLLCDLAAMRDLALRFGQSPHIIEPLVPVDLVVDHSVQVDHYRVANALDLNMRMEFARNAERYRFIKWGMQAFESLHVMPPGVGIVHQVNLEHLARGVVQRHGVTFPDSLVGTDSHTTMINALGVVAWGVGGIEAEAAMLGQPLFFLTPDVVGVHLIGALPEGSTATDLVLYLTQQLRQANVVGKFVEFFGSGAASLTVPDRATLANMAPEYGATMGFFPVDAQTVRYLQATGRSAQEVDAFESYFRAQGLFGMPQPDDIDYTSVLEFDLSQVHASVAGPMRPQDRIALPHVGQRFADLLTLPVAQGGYGRAPGEIGHGEVLIAAITSCTNTSNPSVMLAAGLLARKALARGLRVGPRVKTSLAPGSRVVSEYLSACGLLADLEQLGFGVVAYGCTTCIGNAGPLDAEVENTLARDKLVCAAVLSGNRNFEARIHPAIRANFLMSPPLVVAFALAGRVDVDLSRQALGVDPDGRPVMLRDIWPSSQEIAELMPYATNANTYRALYHGAAHSNPLWNQIVTTTGQVYAWDDSSYIAKPPFLDDFELIAPGISPVSGARALAIWGDSITTDHISPAGPIPQDSPAGAYLLAHGVAVGDFNSYGSRRGNHEVMVRGTFANVRIRNLMSVPQPDGQPTEGGVTRYQPSGEAMSIHAAALRYQGAGVPTLVFAGADYGSGSSRDWAAKGTRLLGVRAVIAKSIERIHRSNLVGMGVVPLQFLPQDSVQSLGLRGDELFDLPGLDGDLQPQQELTLHVRRSDGSRFVVPLLLRVDTPIELEYLKHGGVVPYVLRDLLTRTRA